MEIYLCAVILVDSVCHVFQYVMYYCSLAAMLRAGLVKKCTI